MPPIKPAARALTAPKPLAPSTIHADGVLRCWEGSYTTPPQAVYHDTIWGRAPPPCSGRLLYKQLVMQTFQAGLSWAIVLGKESGFEERFEGWDYSKVARWREGEIAAALADAGIVRNNAKVRAAVANAAAAVRLDAARAGGFERFCWATCGGLPAAERLLQHASRTAGGSYMRASERTDFETADGVHPTLGVAAAAEAFKAAGFRFLGPAAMLSFMQASGFCNHHKPDCSSFAHAEAAYTAGAAAAASTSAVVGHAVAAGGAGADIAPAAAPNAALAAPKRKRAKSVDKPTPIAAGSAAAKTATKSAPAAMAAASAKKPRRMGKTR